MSSQELRFSSLLGDCLLLERSSFIDLRGSFTKTYSNSWRENFAPKFQVAESFVTVSSAGVLRGFHFQAPPYDQWKLVTCLSGRVLDVVIDLREFSTNYRMLASTVLTGGAQQSVSRSILIPPGFGHSFYTDSDEATILYQVDRPYSADSDQGILWSSVDFNWPNTSPILSERDKSFPSLQQFRTPFDETWRLKTHE